MKIIFLTHHLQANDGWSRYAKDLAVGLRNEGADVLCLVSEITPGSDLTQKVVLGDHLSYIANPLASLRTAIRIRKTIKDFDPDIIHVIVEPYGTIIPFLCGLNLKKRKIVLTVHSTYAFMPILVSGWRRNISTMLTRMMFKKIDLIIAVSNYTKQHLLKHVAAALPVDVRTCVENRIFILAGGVKISENSLNGPSGQRGPKEILFVGALKPRKGLLEAINALAHVQTDFLYRIVGFYEEKSPYVQLLREKISEFGLEKKIIFEGRIGNEKLEDLYRKTDLFLMLSTNNGADFEGYGLVYIEANAHGVPCIGPQDSGVSDAIVNGKTGFLVDQYDPKIVAQKIDQVLTKNTIQRVDCFQWALQNSTDKKAKILSDLYKKLLQP